MVAIEDMDPAMLAVGREPTLGCLAVRSRPRERIVAVGFCLSDQIGLRGSAASQGSSVVGARAMSQNGGISTCQGAARGCPQQDRQAEAKGEGRRRGLCGSPHVGGGDEMERKRISEQMRHDRRSDARGCGRVRGPM